MTAPCYLYLLAALALIPPGYLALLACLSNKPTARQQALLLAGCACWPVAPLFLIEPLCSLYDPRKESRCP